MDDGRSSIVYRPSSSVPPQPYQSARLKSTPRVFLKIIHFRLASARPGIYTEFSRDNHPFLTFTLQNGGRWDLFLTSEEGESIA
jgi:hypothetical protein